ncbi:uncharacterized protein UTRI_04444_B [Ustilago trichophora]|uniref:Zn(2)-C6 fungal-type domain-containing protein n=1 Tax=Ustilago trichophora TaxID=86804 RepID=A0A5C3EBM5_9BASI|nr:uncharacterized protein UTRI_04444_B [Ustilago trichophora]
MPGSVRSHPISVSEASRSSLDTVSSASSLPQLFAKPTHPLCPSPSSSYSSSSYSSSTDHRASLAKAYSQTRSDAGLAVNYHRPPLSITSPSSYSDKASSISGRSSFGSSSEQTLGTRSTSRPSSIANLPFNKQTSAPPNASNTPVASHRRQPSSTSASSAAKTKVKMLDDDFSLPPVSVSASPSGSSRSNRILGPDGQLYTQGEAAKLGLIIRTACEACRNRKLKCSGTLPENGGCERCSSDGIQCVYSARAPIGRPKKRKAEEGEDVKCTPGPSSCSPTVKSIPQSAVKGKAKSKVSPPSVTARVKSEESAYFDPPFTASPALHHVQNSAYLSEQTRLSASPAHSDKLQRHSSHDGHQAAFVASTNFGLYEDPMQTPGVPIPSGSSSRLASTPTVWSQSQVPFAMTPTDTMTPHSVISPALASASFGHGQNPRSVEAQASSSSAAKLPSLDDLSVAAFLQSLDTLEISPAELFQQQQQQHLFSGETSSSGTPVTSNAYGLGTPFDTANTGVGSNMNQVSASSVEQWATSSAILQPGLSFAVPADFSWWDLGINGADFGGSATASVAATPSTEPNSMPFPTGGGAAQPAMAATLSHGSHGSNGDGPNATAHSSPASTVAIGRPRRPTFSADQLWPRGADAGMGQGQIQHTIAATETGLGWSTLPGPNHVAEALSSPIEDKAKESTERSCCSSKSAKTAALSPSTQQSSKVEQNAAKASCCSSKSAPKMPCEETAKPTSCCAGKSKEASYASPPPPKEETKSCCSGHGPGSAAASSTSEHQIEMGPLSTSAAVTGSHRDLDSERKQHAVLHSHHPSKVHCVPNPSGKGCTCLCDMSVALLSVKQVLRETDPHKPPTTLTTNSASETRNTFATDTIQLTLTASQAITAQCACSADCPTCQSDPSTEISASLLVSTALQIYARAVRILREGFAASAMGTGGGKVESSTMTTTTKTTTTTAAAAQSFFGGLDVTIGTYKPSASNAKKIALYAIKLELKDLRRALGKISRMAQNFNSGSKLKDEALSDKGEAGAAEGMGEQAKGQGMNPIDQLVILKLYRQLTELLKTVEGLEDAA